MNNQFYIDLASDFRNDPDHKAYKGGFVLIFADSTYGWKYSISDPSSERPNAVAVDIDNNCFLAVGGDDYNGAASWELLQSDIREV